MRPANVWELEKYGEGKWVDAASGWRVEMRERANLQLVEAADLVGHGPEGVVRRVEADECVQRIEPGGQLSDMVVRDVQHLVPEV